MARLGRHFVLLRREPEGRWTVHRRYHRPDMPAELQVGMTVYTDYASASRLDAARHNRTAIRDGNPDLVAGFDYFRFQRPRVPDALRGRAFSNPAQVSNAGLLRFLGESPARPPPNKPAPKPSVGSTSKPATSIAAIPEPAAAGENASAKWRADAAGYAQAIEPFLKRHCLKCHGPAKQEADFRVDQHLPNDFVTRSAVEKWSEVLNMLDAGDMPPENEPRPAAASVARVTEWIRGQRLRGEQSRGDGRIVLRRLNREEYNNTIRDLLGLDIAPAADFPEDAPAAGFDNIGSALTVSPLHLELYVKTAQEILDRAIITNRRRPEPIRWRFQPEQGNYGLDRHRVNVDGQRIIVNAGNNQIRDGMVVMRFDAWDRGCGFRAFKVPHAGEYIIRVRAAGVVPREEAARRAGPEYHLRRQEQQEAKLSNPQERQRRRDSFERYVLPFAKKHFALDRSYRYGPPRMKLAGALGGRIRVLGEMDVDAPVDNPTTYEIRAWFEPTPAGVSIHNVYHIPKHQYNAWLQRHDGFPRPELLVDWIEIEEPVFASWPPKPQGKILIDSPNRGQSEAAYARDVLAHFMRRAFRRPLREGELDSKAALFQKVRPRKGSFEEAIKTPLIAVLCSPHFLYLVEEHGSRTEKELAEFRTFRDRKGRKIEARIVAVKDGEVSIERKDGRRFANEISLYSDGDQKFIRAWKPSAKSGTSRPLNPFELAARLSYFLWSSMPDDELSELAKSGELTQPATLARQVDRLLADPKSEALVQNFAGQWLRLREVGANPPAQNIFPRYDYHLEISMRRESEAFFAHLLKNDLDVKNFIRSDFVTINERLARFYDIEGVKGDEFRVVKAPRHGRRGGLLTQASILSVTSNGTRTSPVWRGVWILENLLGDPPPPPPPNAGDIPPGVPGLDKATVRERLRIHRQQPQCARCHNRIDPLGFALENFNAAGEWRERESAFNRPEARDDDPPIDASAQLPDGTRFTGVTGLEDQLLRRKDQFMACLAEKMFTYALGRELGYADRQNIEAAVSDMKDNGATLRSLMRRVVTSKPFLTK